MMANNNIKHKCLKKQKGNSLIEYGFYLALVGAALAVLVGLNTGTKTSASKQQEITDISQLTENVRNYFSTKGIYTGLANTVIIEGNLAPRSMLLGYTGPGTGTLVNTTRQAVTVAPATIDGINELGFTITGQLDMENCAGVVSNVQDQYAIINVGGTDVKTLNGSLDMPGLTTACNGGANGLVPFVYTSY